jgi:hypothetical protein
VLVHPALDVVIRDVDRGVVEAVVLVDVPPQVGRREQVVLDNRVDLFHGLG